MGQGVFRRGAAVLLFALAQPAAGETPESVEGCAAVGAPLTVEELAEVVPGHVHESVFADGGVFSERFSLLSSPEGTGLAVYESPQFGEGRARYRLAEEGICRLYDGNTTWGCQGMAYCASGEAEYVGWVEGGDAWAFSRIEAYAGAEVAELPVLSITPRPAYDVSRIAPAPDWAPAEGDVFRGLAGFQGVYIAEGADDGPVIEEYVTAHDYSTGRRANDERRITSSLLRLHRQGREAEQLYHFAFESGTRAVMLGLSAAPGDRIDLATATPGVVDILTDERGEATTAHWRNLLTHVYWTYARWDPATHAKAAQARVIAPRSELLGRSMLVCDSAEMGEGAAQVSLLGQGETCRRYDRAFEVTGLLSGRNALQVASVLGGQEAPLVMRVGEIAVTGDTITIGAAAVPPFVLINTGQFQGWADWMDRTSRPGGRERPVTCRFPLAAADRLGALDTGSLLRFRAELAGASDARVQLDCRLD